MNYPESAGYKKTDTSFQAAKAITHTAKSLRVKCYRELMLGEFTADEIAERLELDILSIRPRLSELRASNFVVDTGDRRPNSSGKLAIVWGVL